MREAQQIIYFKILKSTDNRIFSPLINDYLDYQKKIKKIIKKFILPQTSWLIYFKQQNKRIMWKQVVP